ncbi:CrcB family protein [Bifidobacterium avesanii]|uniref:Fluoride-specific ion channel FluC n=1 Tax=Bifidobacterium avesanii TaxID=1798157 RepID=A0A7K3TII3_9BIFI|nr:CrcB family protein [Bifidobacterium avesanii]KAB8288247.1 camphor resistance protein CrcB [Bifidobacterium avesanii]NEG78716.1 hypothetical protein [Bifidobacterium avesanii]
MNTPHPDYDDAPTQTTITPAVQVVRPLMQGNPDRSEPLMDPMLYLVVFLGGCLGTGMRYGLSLLIPRPAAETGFFSAFHTATFVANMFACFIFACLTAAMGQAKWIPARRRELANRGIGMGMCGGFSTLSALVIEELLNWRGGNFWGVAFYEVMSFACGLALAYAGTRLGLTLTGPTRARNGRTAAETTGDIPITMEDADAAADAFLAAHPADAVADSGTTGTAASERNATAGVTVGAASAGAAAVKAATFAPPESGPVAEAPTEVFAMTPRRGHGIGGTAPDVNDPADEAGENPAATANPLPALVFPSFGTDDAAGKAEKVEEPGEDAGPVTAEIPEVSETPETGNPNGDGRDTDEDESFGAAPAESTPTGSAQADAGQAHSAQDDEAETARSTRNGHTEAAGSEPVQSTETPVGLSVAGQAAVEETAITDNGGDGDDQPGMGMLGIPAPEEPAGSQPSGEPSSDATTAEAIPGHESEPEPEGEPSQEAKPEPEPAKPEPVIIPHIVGEAGDDAPSFGRIVTAVNERRKEEEEAER